MLKKIKQHYKTLAFVALLAFAAVAVAFTMPTERVWALKVDCANIQEQTLDGTVTITKVDENGAYLAGATVTITKETWTGAKDADGNPLPEYGSPEVYTEEIPEGGIVLTPRDEDTSDDPSQIKIAALSFGDITDTRDSTLITTSNETKRKGRITIEETQAPEGYEKLTDPIVFEYEWEIGPLDEYFNVYSVPNAQEYTDEAGKRRVYDYEGCDYPLKIIEKTQASADGEKVQFSEQQGQRRNDHFYEIQITNPPKLGNLTIEKKTVDNKQGTFPFTITAWKEEITATYKKIADLTFGFDGVYAQFTSKVSIQGINPLYKTDYYIVSNDTFDGFEEDWEPIGNEELWNLSLALGEHFNNQDDGYSEIWDIGIDGQTYPVHIYLDDQTNSQGEEYVFGFYLEDNEINASIDELDSSSTGLTVRTIGDVYYVDFSKQGLSPVTADPHTYEFSLANNGDKTIQIPHGYEYTIAEVATEDWELVSVTPSASGTMDANSAEPSKVTFTNKKKAEEQKTGSIVISKTVAGNAADLTKEFEFTVTLTDAEDKSIAGSTFTGTKTDASNAEASVTYTTGTNGEFTISLKNKESLTLEGVPAGAKYTVEEKDYSADGYTTSVGSADGRSASGTIDEDSPSTAAFTNTKNTYGALVVTKAVAGNAADAQKDFSFTVELKTGDAPLANTAVGNDTTDANGKITFTLKHNGSKTITGIPNGTSYVVTEADYTSDGYVTTKSGDTGTIAGGVDSSVTAAFTNTRNAPGSLTIAKNISGNAASADDEFTFTITLDDDTIAGTYSGVEFKAGVATITLKGGTTKLIEGLPNGVGWTVTEDDYSADAYTTSVGGADGRSASGTIDEDTPSTASFTNTKNTENPALSHPPVTVQKKVSGDKPASPETFVFVMAPDDPSYPLQEGATDGRMEVTIVGEGEIEFGIIAFAEPGIYRYTVYEVAGSTAGYTYDDTVYKVVYTVTESDDGALSCDRQILKGDETVNECVFTNNYKETKAPSDPKPEDPVDNPKPDVPGDNPKPEVPADKPGVSSPETGDSNNLGLFGSMLAISLSAFLFVYYKMQKSKRLARRTNK